ncbi:hypothetical protein IAQ61_006958 [Plenodomus lingam]|uniref:uncharacterized protein n=1 Tax=Leptosphaeria maculans TaxID=5022 RepID=UPI003330FC97|nr:hypothetical protein IAQ61_006958 [Plenodomus lingam]
MWSAQPHPKSNSRVFDSLAPSFEGHARCSSSGTTVYPFDRRSAPVCRPFAQGSWCSKVDGLSGNTEVWSQSDTLCESLEPQISFRERDTFKHHATSCILHCETSVHNVEATFLDIERCNVR